MSGPRAGQGTTRHRALRQGLAAGGGHADADEQPRPRGRREPRPAGRLRRHRARGALLGCLRRDRANAARAGRRRDAAGPVGQARRRLPHPRVVAPRPDRQLEPGRRLGQLGRVPPPGGGGADDVRADDRRVLDLHRQPGDRAGDLRVLRGDRPAPLRRLPRRDDLADRGPRRHGRGTAAGDHDERRRRALPRGRPDAPAAPDRDRLPRRGGGRPRGRDRPLPGGQAGAAARSASGWSRTRPTRCPSSSGWASRRTSSPTRRAPTTR